MINFSEIAGNQHIKTILDSKPDFHSYLIEGPPGSGKTLLKDIIAGNILCEDKNKRPCGVCGGCRQYQALTHADYIEIPADIPVKELRDILARTAAFPNSAKKKVYVIDNAEKLRKECQNILLKQLEEPHEFVVFILIALAKESLLKTVVSRCLVLQMMPVPEGEIIKRLNKRYGDSDADRLKYALLASHGYIGAAYKAYEENNTELFNKINDFISSLVSSNYHLTMELLGYDNKSREDFRQFLLLAVSLLKKNIIERVCQTGLDYSQNGLDKLSSEKICRLIELFEFVAENCSYNINTVLWSVYTVRGCRKVLA